MAQLKTLEDIIRKVKNETFTDGEHFISEVEMIDYINEAVDRIEANIHTFNSEDNYFIKYEFLQVKSGQEIIDLPKDIYACKIKSFVYEDFTDPYLIKRLRGKYKYTELSYTQRVLSSISQNYYRYTIVNQEAGGNSKILLLPKSQENSDNKFRLWYIRQAKRLEKATDVCDVPEFGEYMVKRTKYNIFAKEGNPRVALAEKEMMAEEQLMVETLKNKVPDGDNEVQGDFTHYYDMDYQGFEGGNF